LVVTVTDSHCETVTDATESTVHPRQYCRE
jgi:hypothetical protein